MKHLTFEQLPTAISELLDKVTKIEAKLMFEPTIGAINGTMDLIPISEAAKVLDLSVSTIYGKVCRNEIPVNKRGKRLYFDRNELYEWIREGRRKTNKEIRAGIKTISFKHQ